MQYAGRNGNVKRTKLWDEFGYPETLTFDNFYRQYRRGSTGYSAVHKLLDACWIDLPTIIDGDEDRESTATTKWEKAVTKLMKKHWAKIKDADRRNMIGRYSALLIQVRDNRDWWQPIDVDVVKKLGSKALVKLIPAWEPQIKPGNLDIDTWSETYGQPVSYQFNEQPIGDEGTYSSPRSVQVHPDRIILLCEGSEDDNILSGIPLLEAGYNDLLDIEKTKGGSAEGFLKNASRQLATEFDEKVSIDSLIKQAKEAGYDRLGDAMNDKVNKLNSGTDAALVTQGGKTSVLSVAAADPTPSWTVSANSFSSTIQCPFNIMFGKQTGNLASEEDKTAWANRCNGRRWGFQSDVITRVIERFWNVGIIEPPASGEVSLVWSDLLAPSEKEKLANMAVMADVAAKTQQAFGTPAVDENEVRAVGELEPRKEPETPDPNAKPTGKDPLTDDNDSAGPNRDANRTTQ
nr:anti-CBASS Acb1 family protein [Citrobacter portucalensis]